MLSRWNRVRGRDPRNAFAVLAMGRDSANGILGLDEDGDALLTWRTRWQARLHRSQLRVSTVLRTQLGTRVRNPPNWSLLRRTITVHALGGVPEGPDHETGVVDEAGEVHGYPGLFVMDGSRLPAAAGVNPSATILAVAEQSVEAVIRRSGHPGWRAPEWGAVLPAPVPEDAAFVAMAGRRAATAGDGVTFRERMRTAEGSVSISLRAEIRSLDRFLADPAHPIAVVGQVDVPGVAAAAPVEGTLSLFPEGRREAMAYDVRFDDERGRGWALTGTKTIRARTPLGLLRDLTTLQTRVGPVDSAPVGPPKSAAGDVDTETLGTVGAGSSAAVGPTSHVLTIRLPDLVQLGASMRGQGFTRARRLRALARFAGFFAVSSLRRPGGATRPATAKFSTMRDGVTDLGIT